MDVWSWWWDAQAALIEAMERVLVELPEADGQASGEGGGTVDFERLFQRIEPLLESGDMAALEMVDLLDESDPLQQEARTHLLDYDFEEARLLLRRAVMAARANSSPAARLS